MLNNFPIPIISDNQKGFLLNIIDKILNLSLTRDYETNKEKQLKVQEYENQIDVMVYKLYNLTYQEALIINKDFLMSELEYDDFEF